MDFGRFIDERLEPPEDKRELCLVDIFGEEILEGDEYFTYEGFDNVSIENLERYALANIAALTVAEKWEMLLDLVFGDVSKTTVDKLLEDEVRNIGFAKAFDLEKKVAE